LSQSSPRQTIPNHALTWFLSSARAGQVVFEHLGRPMMVGIQQRAWLDERTFLNTLHMIYVLNE
jgi:hypothetical protein